MTKAFAVYSCPLGYILIEHRGSRLSRLQISDSEPSDRGASDSFTDMVFAQVLEYVNGERRGFDLELDLSGCSPFQKTVYERLLEIPYGSTRSYKDIAMAIGAPKASRAVGMANNRNPIHIIVPCHRVVGSRGELTGYAAGLDTKEFLLRLEQL